MLKNYLLLVFLGSLFNTAASLEYNLDNTCLFENSLSSTDQNEPMNESNDDLDALVSITQEYHKAYHGFINDHLASLIFPLKLSSANAVRAPPFFNS